MRVVIAALLGLVAGFALSSALVYKSPSEIALQAANTALAVHRSEPQTACATDWNRLHAEVEKAVRASLAAPAQAAPASPTVTASLPQSLPAAPAAPQGPTQRTEQQAKAHEEKEQLLADATSRGAWTRSDADRARSLLSALSGEDRRDLVSRIVVGINTRALKPEDITQPF